MLSNTGLTKGATVMHVQSYRNIAAALAPTANLLSRSYISPTIPHSNQQPLTVYCVCPHLLR
jgi:hypothetical protein